MHNWLCVSVLFKYLYLAQNYSPVYENMGSDLIPEKSTSWVATVDIDLMGA